VLLKFLLTQHCCPHIGHEVAGAGTWKRGSNTLVLAFRGADHPLTTEKLVKSKRWCNVWTDMAFRMT
jgi:hypothetical protein